MRMRPGTNGKIRWSQLALVALVLVGSVALLSSDKSPYSPKEKAFYADEALVNFVRPGLVTKVTGHTIAADGTVTARFTLTDPRGLPLDREGITTPGNVSVSFILARIPADQAQYVAYTTRTVTSPITGVTAIQASSDSGGTFAKVGEGEYTYTFRTKLPADHDKTATHSIGAYSSRNLTEFDLGTQYDDDVYSFVPNGSAVTKVRDIVADATCSKCHVQLGLHGGSRRSVMLCNMCHTPQTLDPDTGNTVDMKVMTHKIHAGAILPSVQAGKPYIIIGNRQSVHDYSNVLIPSDPRNCSFCHEPGGKQQNQYLTNPNRAACGSCHDDVNFATGENHLNLPQPSDNLCKNCHIPEGELEFDASIKGAHTIPTQSTMLNRITANIVSIENTKAGQKPKVNFTLKDSKGATLPIAQVNRIALVLAGPTSDYVKPGPAGAVSEDPKPSATLNGDVYSYTFNTAIPADAKGSYSIGLEGRHEQKVLEGTTKEMTIRFGISNVVKTFPVGTDPTIELRRQIVSTDKCNGCHANLVLHGENRNKVEQCVLCHNPVTTDTARRPAAQAPAESITFALMVHRIHAGLEQTRDYTIYGFGNTPHNYNHIGFPAPLSTCSLCHLDGTQMVPSRRWPTSPTRAAT